MARLFTAEEPFFGELSNVWRLFVPDRTVELSRSVPDSEGVCLAVWPGDPVSGRSSAAELYLDGVLSARVEDGTRFLELRTGQAAVRRARLHQSKRALYRLLAQHFGRKSPWGALTGIRPTKLFRELSDRHGEDAAVLEFEEAYLADPARTSLAQEIVSVQRPYTSAGRQDVVYVGIPFCPSRCAYCSFIAQDQSTAGAARDTYLDALLRELERAHRLLPSGAAGVYVGGGTPTVMEEDELVRLLDKLRELFPEAREFSVEAGRPDTVSVTKLKILEDYGVNRLCVNPQTTNDTTLERIGRRHTSRDFFDAMELTAGRFPSVNTDIITGLPGEHTEDVENTIRDVLQFHPQNITVHALAIKNAAALALDRYQVLPSAQEAAHMSERAAQMLREAGYRPYYLYRQKYMSGNLENVGYSLPGYECVYNIANMEETASVLAFGAGSISKRVSADRMRIDRAANVKNPAMYVDRVDEMVERKEHLFGDEIRSQGSIDNAASSTV